MSDLQLSIHHNEQSQRFETTVDGTTAYISYVDMVMSSYMTIPLCQTRLAGAALQEH